MKTLHLAITLALACGSLSAAHTKGRTTRKPAARNLVASKPVAKSTSSAKRRRVIRTRRVYSPWAEPTYADSTIGDVIDGEDLTVRRAAVEALGLFNGSVAVADPNTGRLLTIVNQRLALKSGFQPCSTIKVPAALAALSEGIITRDTMLRLYGRTRMTLTEAIAHSNNPYFAQLGIKLGYERFAYYARLYGLGEKAGLDIDGEQPGVFPPAPPKNGGMGMMTSFGEGIQLTPLQLASFLSAIANGGTLYYLQHPKSQEELLSFVPRVKRQLDIEHWIPEVKPGMGGAVEYGTARRAVYDPEAPVYGKTGTCTDYASKAHLGWFGSFNDVGKTKLVVVVLLTGGRPSIGPQAAAIAGNVYRGLINQNYFAKTPVFTPAALISTQFCCAR